MSDQPQPTPWWWGMSAPDIVTHFIKLQGPLTTGEIARQIPADFPMAATPRRFAGEGIKRAVAKGGSNSTDTGLPSPMWGPILTIKVSQNGTLWAAWTDDLRGVLVHGHSLAEVLERFPNAYAEVEAARAAR